MLSYLQVLQLTGQTKHLLSEKNFPEKHLIHLGSELPDEIKYSFPSPQDVQVLSDFK